MSDEFIQSGNTTEVVTETVVSDKSKLAAALLCFFLGFLGESRGKTGENRCSAEQQRQNAAKDMQHGEPPGIMIFGSL